MGKMMKQLFILSLLSSLIALSACQDKVAQTAAASAQTQKDPHTSAYPGKPTAPIRIEYQLGKDIQPGVPLVISISLTPLVDAQQLSLQYTLEGALNSGDPQTQFTFGPTPAGSQVQQNITVIPQTEGRFRVILTAHIDNPSGHGGSRSMSIPIVVGNPPARTLKPAGTQATDPQGNPIIVTPAQEEIIHH
jgi:hypothetical protein